MCFHRRPDCDIGFSGENLFFSSADYGLALASRCDLNKKFKFVLPKRAPPCRLADDTKQEKDYGTS